MAENVRLNNYIQKLGANLEQMESLIGYIANSHEPQKLIDTANQIVQISTLESIPLDRITDYIKQQKEENQRLGLWFAYHIYTRPPNVGRPSPIGGDNHNHTFHPY